MIPQEIIEEIKDATQIKDVISDFLDLSPRGRNFSGICPFNNCNAKALSVSPQKGIYKCFNCGKGGNAINFLMEFKKWDYVQALTYLADKYNIIISSSSEAAKTLRAIAAGYSPTTGEQIKRDSILFDPIVISALKAAVVCLETKSQTPIVADNKYENVDFFKKRVSNIGSPSFYMKMDCIPFLEDFEAIFSI